MTKKLLLLLAPIFLLACGLSRSAMFVTADPIPSPTAAQVESPTPSPTHPQPTQQSTCTVSAKSLHVRESAGVDGVVIGWLEAGQVVTILHDQPAGNWIRIQAGDLTGWINSNYCSEAP
ncbi:MAG TPA: SH3 domain-containing protein [Anaerolineales bacterium]|nr:SH3 domain-containing protein [Anaerolineales bacterium]